MPALLNFERVAAIAESPAAHQHATVLGCVKGKPPPAVLRTLDPSCAR
jgi:hypothetical protein